VLVWPKQATELWRLWVAGSTEPSHLSTLI
jgi:hypothetical protein